MVRYLQRDNPAMPVSINPIEIIMIKDLTTIETGEETDVQKPF